MRVTLNGKPKELEEAITILTLLQQLGLHPQQVAVEINRDIIKRESYESHILHEGDEVEILRFVGGGSVTNVNAIKSIDYNVPYYSFPLPLGEGQGEGCPERAVY
ncbi:MAG TPA: sulfur carrier protein ThiS [bacterium]|nr:sulfur carrier protein ThiS [bacterium]